VQEKSNFKFSPLTEVMQFSYTIHMYSMSLTSQTPGRIIGVDASHALERPWRPCQKELAVVNVALGCSFGCLFCPVQRRGHGSGEIEVRTNLAHLLEKEFEKRRDPQRLPRGVVLNDTTDSFQPIGSLLALTHETMRLILAEGLDIHFRTRGVVPDGFMDLLSTYPGRVHVQVVLFSMDADLARNYEPGAPSPRERLDSIRKLIAWGVDVQGRIEPLIPFVTDTAGHIEDIMRHLRSAGVTRSSAAYLVLQQHTLDRLQAALPSAHIHLIKGSYRGQSWVRNGGQAIRLLSESTRDQGYQRLRSIAGRSDMHLAICRCQDPSMGADCFSSKPSQKGGDGGKTGQLDLFAAG
jgi:DNA repair photolyase